MWDNPIVYQKTSTNDIAKAVYKEKGAKFHSLLVTGYLKDKTCLVSAHKGTFQCTTNHIEQYSIIHGIQLP